MRPILNSANVGCHNKLRGIKSGPPIGGGGEPSTYNYWGVGWVSGGGVGGGVGVILCGGWVGGGGYPKKNLLESHPVMALVLF